jgi:hypothetical protein
MTALCRVDDVESCRAAPHSALLFKKLLPCSSTAGKQSQLDASQEHSTRMQASHDRDRARLHTKQLAKQGEAGNEQRQS